MEQMKSGSRNKDNIISVLLFQQNYTSNLFLGICKKETAYALKNYYVSLENILFSTVEESWLSVQWIPLRLRQETHAWPGKHDRYKHHAGLLAEGWHWGKWPYGLNQFIIMSVFMY